MAVQAKISTVVISRGAIVQERVVRCSVGRQCETHNHGARIYRGGNGLTKDCLLALDHGAVCVAWPNEGKSCVVRVDGSVVEA